MLGTLSFLDVKSYDALQVFFKEFAREVFIYKLEVIKRRYHECFNIFGGFEGNVEFEFEEVEKPLCEGVYVGRVEPNGDGLLVSTSFTLMLHGFVVVKGETVRVKHHASSQLSTLNKGFFDRKYEGTLMFYSNTLSICIFYYFFFL